MAFGLLVVLVFNCKSGSPPGRDKTVVNLPCPAQLSSARLDSP